MTPHPHAYGVRAVHGNVVYLGRLQPARRTDEELALAIEAHTAQILREQRERDDQYAGLRDAINIAAVSVICGLVAYGAIQIIIALAAAFVGGEG